MKEHSALKNLYKEVVSGIFDWERWGLLSVLSDYVLYYHSGHILEIGCGESSIHLSKLAEKYNRRVYHVEYSKSGVENMKNTTGYFGKNSEVYTGKSDDFFNEVKIPKLALAFIDGDHNYEQAKKDFDNTIRYVIPGGFVFLHDTYPPDMSWTVPEKCGTVYKLLEELQDNFEETFTFHNSAFDVGLTMVRNYRK